MTSHYHAVLWMDHAHAKILSFTTDTVDATVVEAGAAGHHAQHKANVPGAGHKGVDHLYFDRVIAALDGIEAILLTGPAHAKLEFHNYVKERAPKVDSRIRAVESSDHPTERELVAHARKFFHADDRLHAQR